MSDAPVAPVPDGDAASVRGRMLAAALRLVERAGGLTVTADTLPLDQVIREAGVARTSVYREWPGKEAFYVDLLCELAGPGRLGTSAFDEETVLLVRHLVAERVGDLATPARREALLREVVRRGARHSLEGLAGSVAWRTSVALTAAVVGLPDETARARVHAALEAQEAHLNARMGEVYAELLGLLGYRLRPHVRSVGDLVTAAAATLEGFGVRGMLAASAPEPLLVLDGPDGPQEWHLGALAFLAVVTSLSEPVPDHDPDAALVTYLKRLADREAAHSG